MIVVMTALRIEYEDLHFLLVFCTVEIQSSIVNKHTNIEKFSFEIEDYQCVCVCLLAI